MSKVKLLSNLDTENGLVSEGSVVSLPDEQANHLVQIGAAELTDEAESAVVTDSTPTAPVQEVEPAADPLVEQTAGPSETSEAPKTPEPTIAEIADSLNQTPTPTTPPSSETTSPNLHLG